MTDYNGANTAGTERRTLFRVSLVAVALIAAGLSLGAWEDRQDARSPPPQMIVLGQSR